MFLLKEVKGLLPLKLFFVPNDVFGLFNNGLKKIFLFFKLVLFIGIGDFLGIPLGFFSFVLFPMAELILLLLCFCIVFMPLLKLIKSPSIIFSFCISLDLLTLIL